MAGSYTTIPGYRSFNDDIYYKGTSTSYYRGDGSGGYLRGSSTTVYKRGSEYTSALYVPSGSGSYRNVSLFTGTLYYSAGSSTYYSGNGDYVTGRGSGVVVTPIGSKVGLNLYLRDNSLDTGFTAIGDKCTFNLATFITRDATVLTV